MVKNEKFCNIAINPPLQAQGRPDTEKTVYDNNFTMEPFFSYFCANISRPAGVVKIVYRRGEKKDKFFEKDSISAFLVTIYRGLGVTEVAYKR